MKKKIAMKKKEVIKKKEVLVLKIKLAVAAIACAGMTITGAFLTAANNKDTKSTDEITTEYTIDKLAKTITELSDNGIDVEQSDNLSHVYYIKSLNPDRIKDNNKFGLTKDSFGNMDYDVICTPSELCKYVNDYKEITWDDVIDAIGENKSLEGRIGGKLIELITHLKYSGVNYNLYPLYYNMKNINLRYVEYGYKNAPISTFNCFKGEVCLKRNEVLKDTDLHVYCLCKELLGHGSQEALINSNGKNIYCTTTSPFIMIDPNGEIITSGTLGESFKKFMTDVLTHKALNKKIDCFNRTGYSGLDFYCNNIFNSCNGNYSDYINKGIFYLVKIMADNNISEPYYYIQLADNELFCYKSKLNGETTSFSRGIEEYLYNLIDNKIKDGWEEHTINSYIDDLINKNKDIMDYRIIQGRECFHAQNTDGVDEIIYLDDIMDNVYKHNELYGVKQR